MNFLARAAALFAAMLTISDAYADEFPGADARRLDIEYPIPTNLREDALKLPFATGKQDRSPALALSDKLRKEGKVSDPDLQDWSDGCELLGDHLRVGGGLYGTGFFSEINCLDKGESSRAPRRIRVFIAEQLIVFQIERMRSAKSGYQVEGLVRIAKSKASIHILKTEQFAAVLAYAITQQLPGQYLFSRSASEKETRWLAIKLPEKISPELLPKPDATLVASRIVSESERDLQILPDRQTLALNSNLEYSPNGFAKDGLSGDFIARSGSGLGMRWSELEENLAEQLLRFSYSSDWNLLGAAASQITRFVESTIVNGYFGLRVGFPVGETAPVLSRSKAFSILAIVRGGPLDGLRYTSDFIAESSVQTTAGTNSIDWSRHLLGFSLGWQLDWLRSAFDLTPKIGVWTMNYHDYFVAPVSGRIAELSIDIKNRFSLGLEIGYEMRYEDTTLRTYFALDRAVTNEHNDRLDSRRLGVDFYWSGFPQFSILSVAFSPTLIAFFMNDRFTLNQGKAQNLNFSILDATVASSYTGAGVALMW